MTYTIENLMAKLKDNKEKVINYSNKINDEIAINLADALKVNNSLESLSLSHSELTDYVVVALADALKVNNSLKSLSLSRSKISDKGAAALAEALKVNQTLENLWLDENEITKTGATALAEALKVNQALKILWLKRNNIEKEGAIALAEALKVNSNLITLHVETNQITDEGIKALKQICDTNENFELYCSKNYELEDYKLEVTNAKNIKFKGTLIAYATTYHAGEGYIWEDEHLDYEIYKTAKNKFICRKTKHYYSNGINYNYKVKICENKNEVYEYFGFSDLAKELYYNSFDPQFWEGITQQLDV